MEQELPTLPGHLSLARFDALVWHIRWSLVYHSLYSYQDITVFGQYKLLHGR
jgi:hypothetical protein